MTQRQGSTPTPPRVALAVGEDGVAEIALDDPERKNAMSKELLAAFADAIARVKSDRSVRVVLITGRGKHFCTGADLGSGVGALAAESGGDRAALERGIRAIYDPFLSILDLEIPTIAVVRGAAIGGGLGLALACDLRICAEDARLQANFVKLGIAPGMGITHFLPRLVGHERAAELLFTGRAVSGAEAVQIGLALRAVPAEKLDDEARALALDIAGSAPTAVRHVKRALTRAEEARAAADVEARAQSECALTGDAAEGVVAWLEKRTPRFRDR